MDNDATPTLSIDDVTVNEGAGTATFTVTLERGERAAGERGLRDGQRDGDERRGLHGAAAAR